MTDMQSKRKEEDHTQQVLRSGYDKWCDLLETVGLTDTTKDYAVDDVFKYLRDEVFEAGGNWAKFEVSASDPELQMMQIMLSMTESYGPATFERAARYILTRLEEERDDEV